MSQHPGQRVRIDRHDTFLALFTLGTVAAIVTLLVIFPTTMIPVVGGALLMTVFAWWAMSPSMDRGWWAISFGIIIVVGALWTHLTGLWG